MAATGLLYAMSKMFSSSSMKRLLTCSLNDKKIAKTLSPGMGFQLSLPPTGIGYNANLPHSQRNVKRSLTDRLHAKQEQLTQRDPGGRKQEVQKERKDER